MKLKIIDGYNGGVAHISASMIRDHNISMYGTGDFVLPLGNQFAHEIVNNNNIKIKDGIGVIGGARFVIEYGQTETVTIENGTSGYKRNDIIVAEYKKNSTTLVESVTLKVVKGAIGSTGSDPALSQGNIRAGATVRQMPLYRVKLNGLTIESVEKMWTAFVTPIEKGGTDATTAAAACSNLGIKDYIVEQGTKDGWDYMKYASGKFIAWKRVSLSFTCGTASGSVYYSEIITLNLPFTIVGGSGVANISLHNQCFASNVVVTSTAVTFRAIRGANAICNDTPTHVVVLGTY